MTEKIKKAKANTMMRVNNVIWAKITDSENSKWRSAFGEKFANEFINMVRQAESVQFLNEEPLKPEKFKRKNDENTPRRRKFVAEKYNVREEESNISTD